MNNKGPFSNIDELEECVKIYAKLFRQSEGLSAEYYKYLGLLTLYTNRLKKIKEILSKD